MQKIQKFQFGRLYAAPKSTKTYGQWVRTSRSGSMRTAMAAISMRM